MTQTLIETSRTEKESKLLVGKEYVVNIYETRRARYIGLNKEGSHIFGSRYNYSDETDLIKFIVISPESISIEGENVSAPIDPRVSQHNIWRPKRGAFMTLSDWIIYLENLGRIIS